MIRVYPVLLNIYFQEFCVDINFNKKVKNLFIELIDNKQNIVYEIVNDVEIKVITDTYFLMNNLLKNMLLLINEYDLEATSNIKSSLLFEYKLSKSESDYRKGNILEVINYFENIK